MRGKCIDAQSLEGRLCLQWSHHPLTLTFYYILFFYDTLLFKMGEPLMRVPDILTSKVHALVPIVNIKELDYYLVKLDYSCHKCKMRLDQTRRHFIMHLVQTLICPIKDVYISVQTLFYLFLGTKEGERGKKCRQAERQG